MAQALLQDDGLDDISPHGVVRAERAEEAGAPASAARGRVLASLRSRLAPS